MAYLDLHVVCSIIYSVHATPLHLYCLHVVYQSECTVLILMEYMIQFGVTDNLYQKIENFSPCVLLIE